MASSEDGYLDENMLDEDEGLEAPLPSRSTPYNVPRNISQNGRSPTTNNSRFVIAIDFGTTYCGIAFANTESSHADLDKIAVIQNWTPRMSNLQKVRVMISYAKAHSGEQQWGTDVSNTSDAMVNMKLELEPQSTLQDELELTLHVLKRAGYLSFDHLRKNAAQRPYTAKSPETMVADYLTKVYESTQKTIGVETLARTRTPVDLVVTVPVNWSYQAKDATFKAIRRSGFNRTNFPSLKDEVLVTEPEAASYFTARDHHINHGSEFLEENDCFILCDAGGGTVDVVSYQVETARPHLELEKATQPKSRKCGSTFIDLKFKQWLRRAIGADHYDRLDPANAQERFSTHTVESGAMRQLLKKFEEKKKGFSNSRYDVTIELPAPLDRLDIENRVREGELIIYWEEMKGLFDDCINDVIELIEDQVDKVKFEIGRKIRHVFLVGGFGASVYLQEELQESLDLREMKMIRPDKDKSWTAVVQGAVIYGIEKSRHRDANYMSAITRSYGVVSKGRFQWLIEKGDLVQSREKRTVYSEAFSILPTACEMGQFKLPIYTYRSRYDDESHPVEWQDWQHDVEQVGLVTCDLSRFLDQSLRAGRMHETSNAVNPSIGPLWCRCQLSTTFLEVEVLLREACVGRSEIQVEVDQPRRVSTASWRSD